MNLRRNIYFGILALALFGLFLGCAAGGKYGKLRATKSGMTIEQLSENWKDYHVYWTGPGSGWPVGLAFDPKNDDRELQFGSWWGPVKTQKQLMEIIGLLKVNEGGGIRMVFLYLRDILDSDGQHLFGYVYTYDIQVVVRVIDEKTLSVAIVYTT
jgi:hypothetical protein